MAFPILNISPVPFAQANPGYSGANAMNSLLQQMLANQNQRTANQYQGPTLQEQLLKMQNDNKLLSAQAAQAPQRAQAELAELQAKPQYTLAQVQEILKGKIPLEQNQATLADKEAQLKDFYIKNPLLSSTGPAGQVGAMIYLKQHPELDPSSSNASPSVQNTYSSQMPNNSASNNIIPSTSGSALNQIPNLNSIQQQQGQQPQQGMMQPQPQTQQQNQGQYPGLIQPQQDFGMSGQNGSLSDFLKNGMNVDQNLKLARTNYFNKMNTGYNYRQLPIDQRSALIAQAAGMGYDPMESEKLFMAGNKVSDLATAKGFDPNQLPDPIYPATQSSLNQIQNRQSALSELDTLSPIITDAVAPYSQRIFGYSPKLIAGQLATAFGNNTSVQDLAKMSAGSDPDSQAKLLAARAIIPELSAIRFRAMQGKQLGIEVMNSITESSMNQIKAAQALVTPEVYTKANSYIDKWISQGVNSANKSIMRNFAQSAAASPNAQQNSNMPTLQQQNTVKVQLNDGRIGTVPKEKLNDLVNKFGAKVIG